jgi:hypothetical protein
MKEEGLMQENYRVKILEEGKELKRKFRSWTATADAREVLKNLFLVFSREPVDGADGLAHARFTGRMDVLNYIVKHGEILGGNGDGK